MKKETSSGGCAATFPRGEGYKERTSSGGCAATFPKGEGYKERRL